LISHRREQLWILFLISSAEEKSYGSSSSTEERSTYGSTAKSRYRATSETGGCGGSPEESSDRCAPV
jgi:hypothetical protein